MQGYEELLQRVVLARRNADWVLHNEPLGTVEHRLVLKTRNDLAENERLLLDARKRIPA
jgi:hypothetical protein